MKVFVFGTGRCGTVTFAEASKYINNYTVAHESQKKQVSGPIDYSGLIDYPDNHIESDCHLFWLLPVLIKQYPSAMYVHLQREKDPCVISLSKRPSIIKSFRKVALQAKEISREETAAIYYDFVNSMISLVFQASDIKKISMKIPPEKDKWGLFWKTIGANGDFQKSWKTWNTKYNISR